jgi:hypothetical protein
MKHQKRNVSRGPKTHRADQLQNRGPAEESHKEEREDKNKHHGPSNNRLKAKDEHPTGRMTRRGYRT